MLRIALMLVMILASAPVGGAMGLTLAGHGDETTAARMDGHNAPQSDHSSAERGQTHTEKHQDHDCDGDCRDCTACTACLRLLAAKRPIPRPAARGTRVPLPRDGVTTGPVSDIPEPPPRG